MPEKSTGDILNDIVTYKEVYRRPAQSHSSFFKENDWHSWDLLFISQDSSSGNHPGDQEKGRHCMRRRDTLTRDLAEISVSLNEVVRAAQDRQKWSKLVEAPCGS